MARTADRAEDTARRQIRSLLDGASYAYSAAGALSDAPPVDQEVVAFQRELLERSLALLLKAQTVVVAHGLQEDYAARVDTEIRETSAAVARVTG